MVGRTLIIIGLAIAAVGLLWPYLTRLGLSRLPGNIYIQGERGSFYFSRIWASVRAFRMPLPSRLPVASPTCARRSRLCLSTWLGWVFSDTELLS